MGIMVGSDESMSLPVRAISTRKAIGWPVCGRVVDVSGGPDGRALRCHLAHGHRGECDELGSAELQHWQAGVPADEPIAADRDHEQVSEIALAHARTYESVAQWKRERGATAAADRLFAMADALRHLVRVLDR